MTDVTIPADVAKDMATFFRGDNDGPDHDGFQRWADLLDPKPPTLREKVAEALRQPWRGPDDTADRVLAVIADEMAKRPLAGGGSNVESLRGIQRDADVAWLRGEQS